MPNLQLTLACWNYDRTRALMDGSVSPQGIDLTYLDTFPAETFQRMVKYREFDVSELGFKFYVSSLEMDDPPFIAIPVFPLRLFRHSAIFINTASGISSPKDLSGKSVGEPFAYGHDAAIWARGILSDEYGVPVDSVSYHVGAVDKHSRRDFAPFPLPANIRIEQIGPDRTLDAMLAMGEIQALYSAIVPPAYRSGSANVARLFEDFEPIERAYYAKTKIFPIMHLVAIKRDVYRKHPWVAQSLYKAFNEAKSKAYALYAAGDAFLHGAFTIPWLTAHLGENRRLMGDDLWPYGIEANRKTIETFLRYHHEQGLSKRLFTPEDLFARETLVEYASFSS